MLHVRATSGGLPVGEDLCNGTLIGESPPVYPSWDWVSIVMSPEINLVKDNVYALFFSHCYGDQDNQDIWRISYSSTYPAGNALYEPEWLPQTSDFTFEIWGNEVPVTAKRLYLGGLGMAKHTRPGRGW